MTKPQGKPPVLHKIEGKWPHERNICGAEMRGWPEKWVATEEWLHEIKACPKCKELEPTLQGWDEILKEKYGDAWNDHTLARQERQVQKQTAPPQTVRQGLYLRQYARRQR